MSVLRSNVVGMRAVSTKSSVPCRPSRSSACLQAQKQGDQPLALPLLPLASAAATFLLSTSGAAFAQEPEILSVFDLAPPRVTRAAPAAPKPPAPVQQAPAPVQAPVVMAAIVEDDEVIARREYTPKLFPSVFEITAEKPKRVGAGYAAVAAASSAMPSKPLPSVFELTQRAKGGQAQEAPILVADRSPVEALPKEELAAAAVEMVVVASVAPPAPAPPPAPAAAPEGAQQQAEIVSVSDLVDAELAPAQEA